MIASQFQVQMTAAAPSGSRPVTACVYSARRQTRSVVIKGFVVNERGNPIAGARVYWLSGPVALPEIAAVTDARGLFSLTAPTPGRYELACAADRFPAVSRAVDVKAQDTAPLRIELRRSTN